MASIHKFFEPDMSKIPCKDDLPFSRKSLGGIEDEDDSAPLEPEWMGKQDLPSFWAIVKFWHDKGKTTLLTFETEEGLHDWLSKMDKENLVVPQPLTVMFTSEDAEEPSDFEQQIGGG